MSNTLTFLPSREEVQARYSVRLLADPQPAPSGLVHRTAEGELCESWDDVQYALAAEIGEPQGIRTIAFDLLVARGEEGFTLLRFDAEPGEDAESVAQVLAEAIPAERLGAEVKNLATHSVIAEWFPDVASFEESALQTLAKLFGSS